MSPASDTVDVVLAVLHFFQNDVVKTKLWFDTPNPLLGGLQPMDMIQLGRFEKLRRFVEEAMAANERAEPARVRWVPGVITPPSGELSPHEAAVLAIPCPACPAGVGAICSMENGVKHACIARVIKVFPPHEPVAKILVCPACGRRHVDRGEWATTRVHRKHLCEHCGHIWKPFDYPTVGVETL